MLQSADCEPGALLGCVDVFSLHLTLSTENLTYTVLALALLGLLIHSYWPQPEARAAPEPSTPLEGIELEIADGCDQLSWITTGILVISLLLSVLRPDPTPAVTLFGFYGTHVRSKGSIRSFWTFLAVTIVVDVVWLLEYSPLHPIDWATLQQLTRKEQLACVMSAVNALYKAAAVYTSIVVTRAFERRERLLSDIAAGGSSPGGPCSDDTKLTSSGEPLDARSLAAQQEGAATEAGGS